MSGPRFQVERFDKGCEHCDGGSTWFVVDKVRDCGTGRTFLDKEHAEELAHDMNYAYELDNKCPVQIEELLRIHKASHLVIQQSDEGFRVDVHFLDKQTKGFAGEDVQSAMKDAHQHYDIPF